MKIKFREYGLIRVAVASPEVRIANCEFNTAKLIEVARNAFEKKASLVLFPELSITSYSCGDLFYQKLILSKAIDSLKVLKELTASVPISIIAGFPLELGSKIFNCAAFINGGSILGIVPKTYLPNTNEFYEERWFSSADELTSDTCEIFGEEVPIGNDLLFSSSIDYQLKIGIEICEDLWAVKPVSSDLALAGASIILNLSASNELLGKTNYRRSLVAGQSGRTNSI